MRIIRSKVYLLSPTIFEERNKCSNCCGQTSLTTSNADNRLDFVETRSLKSSSQEDGRWKTILKERKEAFCVQKQL